VVAPEVEWVSASLSGAVLEVRVQNGVPTARIKSLLRTAYRRRWAAARRLHSTVALGLCCQRHGRPDQAGRPTAHAQLRELFAHRIQRRVARLEGKRPNRVELERIAEL
jgi:hypothetical protein